jgi:DNA-binding NtrC family response regulator
MEITILSLLGIMTLISRLKNAQALVNSRLLDKDALILMVTAFGSLESAEEAVAKGAFDYISKPFRKEQLLLAIDKAMRWREMALQIKELQGKLEKE